MKERKWVNDRTQTNRLAEKIKKTLFVRRRKERKKRETWTKIKESGHIYRAPPGNRTRGTREQRRGIPHVGQHHGQHTGHAMEVRDHGNVWLGPDGSISW